MTNYLRPGSISYTGIQTTFAAGSLQVVDWHYWSSQASAIATVRANDGEVIQYCEPPRLTPGLAGNPTAASFYTPSGHTYDLAGWTAAGWLYGGNKQRPNPAYPGSYAGDLSGRNGMTGTTYMQHIVQWCCDRANDSNWKLDGFMLDSTGNDSMDGAFTGWGAGEAADFDEGGAILTLMLRDALGPDAVIVCNNFFNANGSGPSAAAAANGIVNEHHDDAPTGGTWLANDYARCTNAKRRIIYIPATSGCTRVDAVVNTLVTHVCVNQASGGYSESADAGTCANAANGAWPADAGHVHLMDSTTWGANPSGATGGGTTYTKTLTASATGTPSIARKTSKSLAVAATGSARLVKRTAKRIAASANGAASLVHVAEPKSPDPAKVRAAAPTQSPRADREDVNAATPTYIRS